jgi:hypothetical protein
LANRGTHIPAGLISPWIIITGFALLHQGISQAFYKYPWFIVAGFVFLSAFIGERIPDGLEPAKNNPRHRGIVHWAGFLAIGYIVLFLFAFPYLPWLPFTYETFLGLLIVSFLAGYASHIVLDYFV